MTEHNFSRTTPQLPWLSLSVIFVWLLAAVASSPAAPTEPPAPFRTLPLRIAWGGGQLFSPLARLINESQHRCDKVVFHHMRNYGMGSDLHTWSQALCNAMALNSSLAQRPEPWIWNSHEFCSLHREGEGPWLPLECYFLANTCPVARSEVLLSLLTANAPSLLFSQCAVKDSPHVALSAHLLVPAP